MAHSTLTNKKAGVGDLRQTTKSKRPDIQGLRAIAVLAVIFDHLVHWPSGGFVGVDVFFVISGFLITGLLLREHDRTGTISFSGFYRRRARRILPASVVVLAVTALVGFFLLNASRAQATVEDALWSLLFSANWHFSAAGTDYFQASGPVSPLRHFWSLAVEEQFYFVWPWLMLFIFSVGGRSTKWDTSKAHRVVGLAMLVIAALSFGWALFETTARPTVAYFSTFTRTWELGIGALLAVLVPVFKHIPAMLRPVLAWAGIAGIFWSIFSVATDMPFPAPWAAAPVLATALVIAAGTGGEQRFIWPLTNGVTGYVGDISYSLYLWHFPVIIFLGSLIKESSALYVPVAVIAMLALSVLSFHFIEEPVRKSTWLENPVAALPGKRKRQRTVRKRTRRLFLTGILAIGLVVYALAGVLTSGHEEAPQPAEAASGTNAAARADAVKQALTADAWPKLNPDIGELRDKGHSTVSCHVAPEAPAPAESDVLGKCLNGDRAAPKTAFLLGDSYAAALAPGVVSALIPEGYKVVVLARSSCPAVQVDVRLKDGSEYNKCSDFQNFVEKQVAKHAPDLVVISDWHGHLNRLASGASGTEAITQWKAALSSSAQKFAASANQVAVVAGPPTGRDLQECATPVSKPADCVSPVPAAYKNFSGAERSTIASLGRKAVKYVPVQDWYCTEEERCPPFIGTSPVYVDGGHLTAAAAQDIAPLLRASLR
ncbi:peptidoglycan/LPS O-acetylase OafA/YrhL [Arthrobacter sp. V1I9]|uniref:acyltransferase family protein n=1 Tax=Arthrobacter sp. V1I9 TaxID=3042275 RepID=UPI002791494C|nr:acyltransferase family protein [Arthrobacter sp. V1I9]MDQ0868580.1 peptidoglycan/LPS O-acetylase OafA/YrhL [Arthrobacter sp. V1I9]